MQVSVETTRGLERRMKVEVEEAKIAEAVDSRLKSMTKTTRIKGFRAGKVPLKVVKQQYGRQVRQEVLGEVLQSSFYEAVTQEKLRPAGMPNFDTENVGQGEGLAYVATFEVYPEVTLANLDGVTVEQQVVEINDKDIDDMLETVRKQHKAWQPVERAVNDGDQVTLDFAGSIDDVPFEGGSGVDMSIEIGSGRMIDGFEEGLKGMKVGEEKVLDLKFPENYHQKDLAGKPVKFTVTVKKVAAAVLPEIDAELAKKLGIAGSDVDKLRDEIKQNMQRELDTKLLNKTKQVVMDKLLEIHDIEIPAALVEEESRTLMQQMEHNLASQGMKKAELKMEPAMFAEQGLRRVKLGLIMSEIVRGNNLKVDDKRVRAKIEEIAASYEHPEQVVSWYYSDKQRLNEIESLVFEDQIVDLLLKKFTVDEKPAAFSEVMKPAAENGSENSTT